jgi:hypothetical protein|tara:strand:+ start:390 stop:1178 length:789 start_codon:yes stop_codon:yes gene_type:complete
MATSVTSSIETKPVKPKPVVKKTRKRKKKGKNYYFNIGTEKAIIRYNKTDDAHLKNKIYNEHIRKAFDKLAENIIHTFKFYYFDVGSIEVKHEVVSFLVMNIHKFKEGKGKAFSYFSIVAKNYLILNNNKNYKMGKIHSEMKVLDYKRNLMSENTTSETSEKSVLFVDELHRFWDTNLTNIFRRDKDIRVADGVLHIFRIKENIENFNKKALYILIREMTGSNTQHITRIINVMKKYNKRLLFEFDKDGTVDVSYTGSLVNN